MSMILKILLTRFFICLMLFLLEKFMNIGIDIDDTLTRLIKAKHKHLKKYLKDNNMPYKIVDKKTNDYMKMVNWTNEECQQYFDQDFDFLMIEAKPRLGVRKYITKLQKEGHKIIIITARKVPWNKEPVKMTVDWFNKYKIPYDELLTGYFDKSQIVKEKNIDIFIDDRIDTLRQINNQGIKTALMEASHNQNIPLDFDCYKLNNWKQAYKLIKTLEK